MSEAVPSTLLAAHSDSTSLKEVVLALFDSLEGHEDVDTVSLLEAWKLEIVDSVVPMIDERISSITTQQDRVETARHVLNEAAAQVERFILDPEFEVAITTLTQLLNL